MHKCSSTATCKVLLNWPPSKSSQHDEIVRLCWLPQQYIFVCLGQKHNFHPFPPPWATFVPSHFHYHVVNPRLTHCNLYISNRLILPHSLCCISPNSLFSCLLLAFWYYSSFDCYSLSWLLILKTVIKYTLLYPLNFVLYLEWDLLIVIRWNQSHFPLTKNRSLDWSCQPSNYLRHW